MSDLVEFLLARIAEDEAAANHAYWAMQGEWFTTADDKVDEFVRHNSPARVLAECEAKRRIVELHPIYRGPRIVAVDSSGTDYGCELCHCIDPIRADGLIEANGYCETLLALALPYAGHPSYNESHGARDITRGRPF